MTDSEERCTEPCCWCRGVWDNAKRAMRWSADNPGHDFPRFWPDLEETA